AIPVYAPAARTARLLTIPDARPIAFSTAQALHATAPVGLRVRCAACLFHPPAARRPRGDAFRRKGFPSAGQGAVALQSARTVIPGCVLHAWSVLRLNRPGGPAIGFEPIPSPDATAPVGLRVRSAVGRCRSPAVLPAHDAWSPRSGFRAIV